LTEESQRTCPFLLETGLLFPRSKRPTETQWKCLDITTQGAAAITIITIPPLPLHTAIATLAVLPATITMPTHALLQLGGAPVAVEEAHRRGGPLGHPVMRCMWENTNC